MFLICDDIPAPPPPAPPPGFPTAAHQTSVYSAYSVQQQPPLDPSQPKNVKAGSQVVGKGPGSIPKTTTTATASGASSKPAAASGPPRTGPVPTIVATVASTTAPSSKAVPEHHRRHDLPKQQAPKTVTNPAASASSSYLNGGNILHRPRPHQQHQQHHHHHHQQPPLIVGQTSIRPVPPKNSGPQPLPKSALRDYRKPKPPSAMPTTLMSHHEAMSLSNKKVSSKSSPSVLPPGSIYQHLPRGLTITEIDKRKQQQKANTFTSATKPQQHIPLQNLRPSLAATSTSNANTLQFVPVHSIPSSTSSPKRNLGPMLKNGDSGSRILGTGSPSGGHPGLPNGLLRMATTSLQQQQHQPAVAPPKVATKVVPKDLKSQLALSKIGLPVTPEEKEHQVDHPPLYKRPTPPPIIPPEISVSMAQSAVSALIPPMIANKRPGGSSNRGPLLKQSKSSNNNFGKPGGTGGSPNSSRSSSRNSSLSPKEKSGGSKSGSPNHSRSPSSSSSSSAKKLTQQPSVPLIPWSKRNNGAIKKCNGWTWVGEGVEQKVYISVSSDASPVRKRHYKLTAFNYFAERRASNQSNLLPLHQT